MKVINEKFEEITEYDLETGFLVPTVIVKKSAAPIDNKKKFAWDEADYEEVQMYFKPEQPQPSKPSLEERLAKVEGLLDKLLKLKDVK